MKIGLVGSGNMARAMARGWGQGVLCTDAGSGRAAALAAEFGGEALDSNLELAQRADVVVLCHKPGQLDAVASEIAGNARVVVSVLGATPLAALSTAYPGTPVVRTMPNTPVEVRRGVICWVPGADVDPALESELRELFGVLGHVIPVPEAQLEIATGIAGVGPAYVALVAEAQVDAAVRRGMPEKLAAELVVETLAGTAALLAKRDHDMLAVRREVTSPGGSTARGLAALERGGLRAAFDAALDAVAGGDRQ